MMHYKKTKTKKHAKYSFIENTKTILQ